MNRIRGPPCVAQVAAECKANPSRASQYRFVSEEYRLANSLDESACVCKSRLCLRAVGFLDAPGKPGRKKARTDSSESPPSMAVGKPIEGSRAKPSVIVEIYQIKAVRCLRCPTLPSKRYLTAFAMCDTGILP